MIQVKNNQTGKVEDLTDDSSLPDLVQSGSVSLPNKEFEFEDDVGEKYKVPAKSFLEAINSGWKYRSQTQIKDENLEEKYGDRPGSALALAIARGLTMGVSDVALEKSGLVGEETLREIKNRNEVVSTVGEIGATVAPVFLTGGTSLLAKAAQKTAPGIIAKIAGQAGKRAALNVESKIAQGVVSLGVEGAIEGAATGVTETISEAELGDAEFNAETLLANVGTGALLGGGTGALFGGGIAYAKKALKGGTDLIEKQIIENSDLPSVDKKKLLEDSKIKRDLSKTVNTVFEDAEFKKVAAENNWPTTPGMETRLGLFQTLESSIAEGASAPAAAITKNIDEVYEAIDNEIVRLVGEGEEITPLVAGDKIKYSITEDIDSRIQPARDYLKRMNEEFGNADVSGLIIKRLENRLMDTQAFRIGKGSPVVKEIVETLPTIQTFNDLEYFRKKIGAKLSAARRAGDQDTANILSDVYATTKRGQRDAIGKLSLQLGPKRGPKLAKEVLRAFDDSYKTYAKVYEDYKPLADMLGLKITNADFFLDNLAEEASEVMGKKLIDLNDFRAMEMMYKKFPDIFETSRRVELSKLAKSVTDSASGDISPVRFAGKIRKLSNEQRKILFGFDGKANKRVDDLLKYIEKAPKKLGKSDTATVQFFQKILSPVYQASEYARYLLYKGGEKAIKKHLLDKVPVYKAIEESANKQKNKISSSVNAFFKAAPVGVAIGSMELFSEKELNKARNNYETVQSNPEKLLEQFAANNKQLMEAAPETGNALQQRLIAGIQFLQSKVPHKDQTYIGENIQPSRSELLKFNDYMDAFENPRIIFTQMKEGYVNPNSIEVLRTVYPRMYENIQAEVVAKMPKKLSRTQKIQLQPLLGSKVTPAMDFKNLSILQGKSGAQNTNQQTQRSNNVLSGQAAKIGSSERAQTGLDKSLYRT